MTNPQVEGLLEHDSFLRALARRLLGDDVAADDVVQEAWLVALRSAKRPEEVRAGWLAGIVKNLVRRARRDHERRARRERTAARTDAVVATDELVAERALRRRIAELVVALPDIYREPLLLRYYDGLSPRSIADRLALPGSTVRTRIQRGLARIRARLEDGNGNGHAFSAATLLAIAAPRPSKGLLRAAGIAALLAVAALLARTPPPSPLRTTPEARANAGGPRAPRPAPGVALMLPAGAVAPPAPSGEAALVLDGIVHLPGGAVERTVRLAFDGGPVAVVPGDQPFAIDLSRIARQGLVRVRIEHPESEPREEVATVPGRMEVALRRRALVPEEDLLAERAAEDREPLADGGEGAPGEGRRAGRAAAAGVPLEGVVRLPGGASNASVLVEAWRPGGARARTLARGGEPFSLDVAALLLDPMPEELRVRASHPDAAPRETGVAVLFDPATGAPVLPFVEIDLVAVAYLEGVVELEGYGPAADATVAVFPSAGDRPVAAARTDAAGRYRIPVDRGGSYLVAAAAPAYAPAGAVAVAVGDAEIPSLVLRAGVPIEGSVHVADAPASRARVRASLLVEAGRTLSLGADGPTLSVEAAGIAWKSVSAETAGDGRFALAGLSARTYRVEVEALSDGTAPPYEAIDVVAPGVAAFAEPVARIAVSVRGDGVLIGGAVVDVRREDGSSPSLRAPGGRVVLLARPGEALSLVASGPGFAPEMRDIVATTGEVAFDLQHEPRFATLRVALRSEDGVALPAVCSFDLGPDRGFPSQRKAIVEDGRFVLEDLEPDVYSVVATPVGMFLPASGRVTLKRGETAELRLDVFACGRISVRFLNVAGPLPDVWVEGSVDPRAAKLPAEAVVWEVDGDRLESGFLAPGSYVLHVLAPDGPRSFPVEVKPTETVRLLIPLG
ncbi:MAG TPA: RNA polymerase sigma factor [Planctomycetota bacterium]|nr:RNA polymerase sigma factor [Planctomycetota bacterium]